jgi:hypothetical protein
MGVRAFCSNNPSLGYWGNLFIEGNPMQTEKNAPQFSDMTFISLERFAWALNVNMPVAVDLLLKFASYYIEKPEICFSCKDNDKCNQCVFSKPLDEEELTTLERVMAIV